MSDDFNGVRGDSRQDKAANFKTNSDKATDPAQGLDYSNLYDTGLAIFSKSGFFLERSPGGSHCGHLIYHRTAPKPVAGITYPVWFKVRRLLESAEDESMLTNTLLRDASATTDVQQFWGPLTQPMSGSKPSQLQGHVERLIRIDDNRRKQNESEPFQLGIQINNFNEEVARRDQSPRAYIPPTEWFSPAVRELSFTDIFTLWPSAESEMLQLILGKAWVGRSGSVLVGQPGIMEHTFRSVGIVVGEDAGLGKSTIFDKLSRATNMTGYKWSNFRDINEQFGLGEVAGSDVAYKDDLTSKSMADLIKSENTKIIASGGRIYAEEKYAKGTSTHARCILLANTNEFNPRISYTMDSGTVDRVKLLSTFRRADLEIKCRDRSGTVAANSPNFAPFIHIAWLAQEVGVSEECLILWACRLCVDKFYALTFRRDEVPTESLRREVHRLSSHLTYSFNKDCTRSLISLMVLSNILLDHMQLSSKSRKPYQMRELSSEVLKKCFKNFKSFCTDSGFYKIKAVLKMHWELTGRPDIHPWSGIRKLSLHTVRIAEAAFEEQLAARKPLADQVKALFGNLYLRDGFTGSSDIVWVTMAWTANTGYVKELEQIGRALHKIGSSGESTMEPVLDASERAVEGKADDSWIDNATFDPRNLKDCLPGFDESFDPLDYMAEVESIAWPF